MSITWFLILGLLIVCVPLIIFGIKKNNLQERNRNQYNAREEEMDKYIKLMKKIIKDKSHDVLFVDKKLQIVKFDIKLIIGLQDDYNDIPKNKLSKLIEFAVFLIKENDQMPIFLISKNKGIIVKRNKSNKAIGTTMVTNINEWIKTFEGH